jgi:hypothetical protein
VGGMYDPTSKLQNKPLTKSSGTFFQEKRPENNVSAVVGHYGAIWAPANGPKKVYKSAQVDRIFLFQGLRLKISP